MCPPQKVLIVDGDLAAAEKSMMMALRYQDCSRFLLHRLHLALGLRLECGHPQPSGHQSRGQTSLFIRELRADCANHQFHVSHTPHRIFRLINMDITSLQSAFPPIWLTSKCVSAGLLSLLAVTARLVTALVSWCQWSVLTQPDQGPRVFSNIPPHI